jgi:hypothetical protein
MCCPYRCLTVTHRTAYTGMMDYMIVSEMKENNNTVSTVFMSIRSFINQLHTQGSGRAAKGSYSQGNDGLKGKKQWYQHRTEPF